MQTFMPYDNFELTAKVLDYRRLGKQRVETKQIMMTLLGESKGWANHPAVKMWRGYEPTLAEYGLAMCNEWINRGYNDSLREYFLEHMQFWAVDGTRFLLPQFTKDPEVLLSHQSNLVRKDPVHYRRFFPNVPDDLPYKWVY